MSLPQDQSFVKIGCLLGAFRDVAQGMGLEVMSVSLTPLAKEPQANYVTSHRSFPQGKTRKTCKILALIQTLSDSIYHEGYIITDIDLRHMDAVQPGTRKTWAMRVAFAMGDNRVSIPSPTNLNPNRHSSAPITNPTGS